MVQRPYQGAVPIHGVPKQYAHTNETNYVLAEGAATTQDFTITPKELDINWLTEGPFTYTGEAQRPTYQITGYVEMDSACPLCQFL